MRLALILLLTILGLAHAADLLILIPAKDAGPTVPLDNYSHPTWILWPVAATPQQTNRLLSLPSGVDWQQVAPSEYLVNRTSAEWLNAEAWQAVGYADALRRNLGSRGVFAYVPKSGAIPI